MTGADRDLYSGLIENQHIIMLIYDPCKFDIVDASLAACEFYGYTRAQLAVLKTTDLSSLPPELAVQELQHARQSYPQPYLLTHRLANGELRDVEVSVGAIETRGKVYEYSIARDITRSRRAEEELRRERNFVSAVLDTVGALVIVLDREGRIVRFNRACEQLTGYTAGNMVGSRIWDKLLLPEETEAVQAVFGKLCAGDFPIDFENHWVTRDGRARLIAWSNTVLAADDGAIEYVIGTGVDITERQQVEAQLRQSNADLEARNAELDAFAHTAAHDIKNPLHIMAGYAELLTMPGLSLQPHETVSALQAIQRNIQKINSITDSLMLLAEVRQKPVVRQELNMAAIVAEVIQRTAHLRDGQIELRLPAEWPPALGYAPWVEQVWVNYLSNALKYVTRPGCVELGAAQETNDRVRFWVHDDGPGIAPEEQTQLFTAFYQTSRARRGGHGVGLSIVKRIVERLGGEVSVTSSGVPGEGSTFSFTLPTP